MNAPLLIPCPIAFGMAVPKPLRNFPPGKVRLRLRPDNFVTAFVRSEQGIRRFTVMEVDGHWEPHLELAANITVAQP